MISFGVLLVILGVGSLALPYLSPGLALTDILNPYQPWAGIIVAALGLITVLFGAQRRGRREATEALAAAAPAAAAPAESVPSEPAATSTATTASAMERAGEPTTPVSTTPPPPAPTPSERAWPTEPPERSDD